MEAAARDHAGTRYLFAVATAGGATTAAFTVPAASRTAEAIDEGRTIPVAGGAFQDAFAPYQVHLYRIRE